MIASRAALSVRDQTAAIIRRAWHCFPVLLALALSVAAGLPARAAVAGSPGRRLVIRDASGTITLRGEGTINGRVGFGSVWASDEASGYASFEFANADQCQPEGGGELCKSFGLRFRLQHPARFDIEVRGSGISVSISGTGTAKIDVVSGSYARGGSRPRPLPHHLSALSF